MTAASLESWPSALIERRYKWPSRFFHSFSGTITITGNTWTIAGKGVAAGKPYQFKGTFVLAPDLASGTYKTEISADGKTWTPLGESRYTKVPPAPKK